MKDEVLTLKFLYPYITRRSVSILIPSNPRIDTESQTKLRCATMPSASPSRDPPFTPIHHLPTTEAYDRWAPIYDTDGNFLQALDDIAMRTLIPRLAAAISASSTGGPRRVVDLGAGTGRNTARLLTLSGVREVAALDASTGMLDVARARLARYVTRGGADDDNSNISADSTGIVEPTLRLETFDMLASQDAAAPSPVCVSPGTADAVLSTLVLEHIPLPTFFRHVSRMLRPGGVLLLSNMHADMGRVSQAGFVDNGVKIRGTSYAYEIEEVVEEARRWGLEVLGEVEERGVREDMVGELGERSTKWVGVKCWFGGLMRKKTGGLAGDE
ncbi:S-adenosyl-L-methionine-dependent methyltransferase [Xylariaceae sp. FL0016]|nr:S-adenosyl-L-methionine-dependent methyltransferase [Xylariaceae sp. FL0016]